jgi:hypothetical protein
MDYLNVDTILGIDSDNGSEFINAHLYEKLISCERVGAKVIKRHDRARTPHQRTVDAGVLTPAKKASLTRTRNAIRPRDLQRRIDTLAAKLQRVALSKTTAPPRPVNRAFDKRDRPKISGEATN